MIKRGIRVFQLEERLDRVFEAIENKNENKKENKTEGYV
jgi:hypothetical protein